MFHNAAEQAQFLAGCAVGAQIVGILHATGLGYVGAQWVLDRLGL